MNILELEPFFNQNVELTLKGNIKITGILQKCIPIAETNFDIYYATTHIQILLQSAVCDMFDEDSNFIYGTNKKYACNIDKDIYISIKAGANTFRIDSIKSITMTHNSHSLYYNELMSFSGLYPTTYFKKPEYNLPVNRSTKPWIK